jgi:hypothetical protein
MVILASRPNSKDSQMSAHDPADLPLKSARRQALSRLATWTSAAVVRIVPGRHELALIDTPLDA